MPAVVIVGNSGAARECYWILLDLLDASPGLRNYYNFAGFLSWHGYKGNLKELSPLFIGDIGAHKIIPGALYIIGVGKPVLRRDIYTELKSRGAELMNLIHPWTAICPSATIGEGNVFQRGCTVYANAVIGTGNYINGAVNLSHDASIGDFNFLAPYSIVLGGTRIGSCNHLGPHSVLLEHTHMGNDNILSSGAILYKGCGDKCIMAGNPALKIGENKH